LLFDGEGDHTGKLSAKPSPHRGEVGGARSAPTGEGMREQRVTPYATAPQSRGQPSGDYSVATTETSPDPLRARALASRPLMRRLLPWLVILAIFLVWEAVVRLFAIEEFVLPAPSAIVASGWQWRLPMLDNAWQTFMTTMVGFLFAVAFGIVTGVAVGASTLVYDGFYPALVGFNSIPKVAVIPILVIWFGVGTVPAILTAFLISFFPILVNVAAGIATVEPELKDVLRALGAPQWQIIQKVGLPRSMPYFFASLKVAITLAFVGSIVAETVAGNKGIGNLMLVASSRFEVPLAFAGLVVTGIMGIGMYLAAEFIERRTIGWATRGADDGGFSR
jgi:NitT/TauT family transport system permease protein